ncbi:hypothetical protein [Streptomyces sp. NPDC059256]|uniref:hypothetical protein n=1 Tax=Streptomyces sp. NPDC059256 TaxID=3346794 RepID=UPI00367C8A78
MTTGPSSASLPYRLLVVEDDDSIRTLLESVLSLTGPLPAPTSNSWTAGNNGRTNGRPGPALRVARR